MGGSNESPDVDAMTPVQFKAFESKVRRMARRQGLSVVKSRSPLVVRTYGGYMLCDGRNCIVAGATPNAYGMGIHQVFAYLSGEGRAV